MKKPRAFTLVELLVVVAIIVVLIAILVPVLSRVRDSAKTAVCQSNLRQIGVALSSYVAKHGAFPVPDLWWSAEYGSSWNGGGGKQNGGANLSWPERLVDEGDAVTFKAGAQYSGWASGIFVCPSHDPQYQGPPNPYNDSVSHYNPATDRGAPFGYDPDHNLINYDVNGCDGYGLNPQMTGVLIANVNPSHLLAADACSTFPNGNSTVGARGITPGDATEIGPADDTWVIDHAWYGVYLRHHGSQTYPYSTYANGATTYPRVPNGANYLFADYHVEWSALYGHISMLTTQVGAAAPNGFDRPAPWNYWLNP